MHPSRPSGRGRLVAAIVVSLSLHALVGLGWLSARFSAPGGGVGIVTAVAGPEDETIVVLLDRRPDPPRTPDRNPDRPRPEPKQLPDPVVQPSAIGVARPSHSDASPISPVSFPNSAGPKPIHGKLRAGQTVVYVLDRSMSMGVDGLMSRAVASLKASLDQLGPDVRF